MSLWSVDDFTRYKVLTKPVSHCFRNAGYTKRADLISDCGKYLNFAEDPRDGSKFLIGGNFCKDRLCPMCNARRHRKISTQLYNNITGRKTSNRFVFVTLTAQNVSFDNFKNQVDAYQKAIKDMMHQRRYIDSSLFSGYVRSFEVTLHTRKYLSDGRKDPFFMSLHPHFHILFEVSDSFQLSDHELRELLFSDWKKYLKKYNPSASLDKKGFELHFIHSDSDSESGLANACCEVTKYALKSSEICAQLNQLGKSDLVGSFASVLKGRRLFVTSRSLKIKDEDPEDLIFTEDAVRELNSNLVYIRYLTYLWNSDSDSYSLHESDFFPALSDIDIEHAPEWWLHLRFDIVHRCRDGDNDIYTKK